MTRSKDLLSKLRAPTMRSAALSGVKNVSSVGGTPVKQSGISGPSTNAKIPSGPMSLAAPQGPTSNLSKTAATGAIANLRAGTAPTPTASFSAQGASIPVAPSGFTSTNQTTQQKIADMSRQAEQNSLDQRSSTLAPIEPPKTEISPVKASGPSVIEQLRSKLTSLSTKSAEEQALENELAAFRESANLGITGLEGQGRGIPLSLVRGEQAKLQQQAAIQEQTLLDRLAAASAERQAQLQAAQGEYDLAAAEQAKQDALTAPMQVGDAILQFDPATGQYKTLYSAPTSTSPVKLSEGESLVDPNTGAIIASFGKTEDPLERQKAELEIAKLQQELSGAGISLSGSQIADAVSKGYTTSAQMELYAQMAATGTIPPAIKEQSSETLKTQALVTSGLDSLSQLEGLVTGGVFTRPLIPSGAYKSAERNIMDALARLRTGAAMTANEESFYRKFLPTSLDSPATAKQKIDQIKEYFSGVQSSTGQGANDPLGVLTGGGSLGLDFPKVEGDTNKALLGSLSERYESGGDPGAIGYDSTGGYSYGAYQLAHQNAKKFVEQSPFAQMFQGLAFNSKAFQNKWKEVAKQYGDQFKQAQKDYIAATHYQPQIQKIESAGFKIANLPNVVKDVIWSTAVQHGANTDIVTKALAKMTPNNTVEDLIKAIYNERWAGGARFASSTQAVKNAVYNRFFGQNGELNQALSQLA